MSDRPEPADFKPFLTIAVAHNADKSMGIMMQTEGVVRREDLLRACESVFAAILGTLAESDRVAGRPAVDPYGRGMDLIEEALGIPTTLARGQLRVEKRPNADEHIRLG